MFRSLHMWKIIHSTFFLSDVLGFLQINSSHIYIYIYIVFFFFFLSCLSQWFPNLSWRPPCPTPFLCLPYLKADTQQAVGSNSSTLELGQLGHLIILIGCSDGEPVHEKSAERTCYLAVGCRATTWCVRATLDHNAADVSRPCSLLSLPLVRRCQLGVYQA